MNHAAELLQVRALGKRFPGARALPAVSLDVRRGEVLAVIGENGTSKSTLMKILAGVLEPDEGAIRLDSSFGSPLNAALPVAKRRVPLPATVRCTHRRAHPRTALHPRWGKAAALP